ncbi:type II toxin-antitoxin system VapC family toxin [Candidatus Margulisiibacteriota bacterium]
MKPIIVDTSIWIDWARGKKEALIDVIRGRIVYMPVTVYMELVSGIRDKESRKSVYKMLEPFERNKRIVCPSFKDYQLAGEVLARLGWSASKFSNDVMIAILTKKMGGLLLTANYKDFRPVCSFIEVDIIE